MVTVVNGGSNVSDGSKVEVSDTLPAGVKAASISGEDLGNEHILSCALTPKLGCSYEGFEVAPGDVLQIRIAVDVELTAVSPALNSATVSGGGAASEALSSDPTTIGSTTPAFGVATFDSAWSDARAAGHPSFTADIAFSQALVGGEPRPVGSVKDIELELPTGVVANTQAVPQCSTAQALAFDCPQASAVGVVFSQESSGSGGPPTWESSLLYSMAPTQNEPAAFTFTLAGVPVWLDATLGPENDYRFRLDAKSLPEVDLLSMTTTLWGVPAEQDGYGVDHTSSGAHFGASGAVQPAPFLTNPDTCLGALSASTLSVDSWADEGVFDNTFSPGQMLTECQAVAFAPSLGVIPDILEADSPSGYTVDVTIPQQEDGLGLSTAELETLKVALPEGVGISPPMTSGLVACSEGEIGLQSDSPAACPDASILGTVEISTPSLASPSVGHIFLAEPYANPFHSLIGVYVVATRAAEGDGVVLKLAGQISLDPSTGRPSLVFEQVPQLPLSKLHLRFNGGPRAPFTSPSVCGAATSTSEMTPWTGTTPATPSSFFSVTGCSTQFEPSLQAAATSNPNGTDKTIRLTVARSDKEQELGGFEVAIPSTVESAVAQAQPCGDAQADNGTCPPASKVGEAVLVAGLGPHPIELPGSLSLTGPYRNGQAGLSIAIPVLAGPFDLGGLVVRASIQVDAGSGEATIVSDLLPTIIAGIPLHLRKVSLALEAGEMEVNPITCEPFVLKGIATSTEEASAPITATLPAAGCKPPASDPGPSVGILPSTVPTVTHTNTAKKRAVGKPTKIRRCSARHRKKAKRKLKCRSPRHRASAHKRGHKATKRQRRT